MNSSQNRQNMAWVIRSRKDTQSPTGRRYVLVLKSFDWEKHRSMAGGPGDTFFFPDSSTPADIEAKGVKYLEAEEYSKAEFVLKNAFDLYEELERYERQALEDRPSRYSVVNEGYSEWRADIYYNLGRLYSAIGSAQEALDCYLLSIENTAFWVPRHSGVEKELVRLCEATNQFSRAIKTCMRALEATRSFWVLEPLMKLCERSGGLAYTIDVCESILKKGGWGRVALDFAEFCRQADQVSHGIEVLWDVLFKNRESDGQGWAIDDPRPVYRALMQLLAEENLIDDVLMVATAWAVRVPRAEYQPYSTSHYVWWALVEIGKQLLRKGASNEVLQLIEGILTFNPPPKVAVQLDQLRDRSLRKLGRLPRIKRDASSQVLEIHQAEQLLHLTGVYTIGTGSCTDICLLGPQPKAFVTKAGKDPRVFLYDLQARQQVWETKLTASSRVYALTEGGCVVMQFKGMLLKESDISYAIHELLFLDSGGTLVNQRTFQRPLDYPVITFQQPLGYPVITQQTILVGCRDGYLYAFDRRGSDRWHFRVPGRKRREWIWPPFPYLVAASENGDAILVNYWDRLYALDGRGRRQWLWGTPEGSWPPPHMIRVSLTGKRYAVATRDNRIHVLDHNGKLINSIKLNDRVSVTNLWVDDADEKLAVVCDRIIVLYDGTKFVRGISPTETFCGITALPDRPYLVCWGTHRLLLIDTRGEIRANVEFSKTIKKVSVIQGNLLIATAGGQVVTLAVT